MDTSPFLYCLVMFGGPVLVCLVIIVPPLVRLAGEFLGVSPRKGRRPLI